MFLLTQPGAKRLWSEDPKLNLRHRILMIRRRENVPVALHGHLHRGVASEGHRLLDREPLPRSGRHREVPHVVPPQAFHVLLCRDRNFKSRRLDRSTHALRCVGMRKIGCGDSKPPIPNTAPLRATIAKIGPLRTVADRTPIHEMSMTDGVMKMRELHDGLLVPAKGSVALKSGSYHLMLLDLKTPLRKGEQFSGTLTFEGAGTLDVIFEVVGMGAQSPQIRPA